MIANETVGGRGAPRGARRRRAAAAPKTERARRHARAELAAQALGLGRGRRARGGRGERLEASLEAMRAAGMTARGEVGDGDPLQAIEDALRTFAPDEIVISTHPEGRSNWLERGVVDACPRAVRAPGDARRRRPRRAPTAGAERLELDARSSRDRCRRRPAIRSSASRRTARRRRRRRGPAGPCSEVRRHARAAPVPASGVRRRRSARGRGRRSSLLEALLLSARRRRRGSARWSLASSAFASMWQAPHFAMKSCLPCDGSPEVTPC